MKKVAILLAPAKYEVLRVAARLVGEGMEEAGCQVTVYDSATTSALEIMQAVQENDLMVSLQAALLNSVFSSGTAFVETIGCKYYGWIFDNPWYHFDKVKNARFPHVYLRTIDKGHVDNVINTVPGAQNIDALFHGGFECKGDFEKTHDVLITGNMSQEPQIGYFIQKPTELDTFMAQNAIKILETYPDISVEDAVCNIFEQIQEELSEEAFRQLIPAMAYVESYNRWNYRRKVIGTLVEAGINLTVIGDGYSSSVTEAGNVEYLGGMDIDQVVEHIAHSKVTVDTSCMYPYGFHERIFTAMLCKSVCFTPYSQFREEYLGDRVNYIDINDMDRLVSDVKGVLNNWSDCQKQIEESYIYAKKNHTWEVRGEQILNQLV